MRRLICTFNIGNLAYGQLTIPWMRKYASRIGADFRALTQLNDAQHNCRPWWARLRIIKDFAIQEVWDALMLVDLDLLILPNCEDIFDLVDQDIGVVQDLGTPRADVPYLHWCRHYFEEDAAADRYFNAGMLVIRRAAARRLANVLHGPYPDELFRDNHYLNLKLVKREKLTWLPLEYNWSAPQHRCDLDNLRIIHFVGNTKVLIDESIQRIQAHWPDA
jgi:hypothetical protein